MKIVLPLKFRAQVITLKNNLLSLTIDASSIPKYPDPSSGTPTLKDLRLDAPTILYLMLAASKDLRKVVIKAKVDEAEELIKVVQKRMGFKPKVEDVEPDSKLIIWETLMPLPAAGKVWKR